MLVLSSCFNNNSSENRYFIESLKRTDSLMFTNKGDSVMREFKKMRARLSSSDPMLATYYCHTARYYEHIGIKPMSLYVDSALSFFAERSRIEKYPNEYFKTLSLKGDVELKRKRYISALNFYYLAKNVESVSICDNGDLDSKLGTIYFNQRNFLYAGRFWGESAKKLALCNTEFTKQRLFYVQQGALNNAGVSYERGGMLDSARYYYLQDLDLVNRTESSRGTEKFNLIPARAVVYDNLGGINLKLGNLTVAKDYLEKCLAMPNANVDGANIPPLIKLAELYLKTGDSAKAADAFARSKALLDRFYKDNPESYIKWHLMYAKYH